MFGIFGLPQGFAGAFAPQQMPPQEPAKKPGFFGEGGVGRGIAGSIGDYLLQVNGMRPIYAPRMEENRRAQHEAQQAERQRATSWEDWQKRFDYERANPKSVNNDTVNDYQYIQKTLGKEAADMYLRRLGDPMVNMTLPGDNFYSGPQSGVGAALGGANPKPRRLGPIVDQIPGGPASAPGGFPR
jgi:hypothetical protein